MARTPRETAVKCPYCGQGLYECEVSTKNPRESYFACPNYDCEMTSGMCGTEDMWADLAATRELYLKYKGVKNEVI